MSFAVTVAVKSKIILSVQHGSIPTTAPTTSNPFYILLTVVNTQRSNLFSVVALFFSLTQASHNKNKMQSKLDEGSDNHSQSSSSLEVPYAMDLSLTEKDCGSDDNGDSDSTGCGSYDSRTQQQREPLRAGDVIRYTHPAFTARHAHGQREAKVVSVDPNAPEYPLVLDSCEFLPKDTFVRRIGEMHRGQVRPHKGRSKVLSSFLLKATKGSHQDALQRQLQNRGRRIQSAMKDIERDAMEIYGSGTAPNKKKTKIAGNKKQGLFPAAAVQTRRRRKSVTCPTLAKSSSAKSRLQSTQTSSKTTGASRKPQGGAQGCELTSSRTATVHPACKKSVVSTSRSTLSNSSTLDSPLLTRETRSKRKSSMGFSSSKAKKRRLLVDPSSSDEDPFLEGLANKTPPRSTPIPPFRQQSISTALAAAKQQKPSPPLPGTSSTSNKRNTSPVFASPKLSLSEHDDDSESDCQYVKVQPMVGRQNHKSTVHPSMEEEDSSESDSTFTRPTATAKSSSARTTATCPTVKKAGPKHQTPAALEDNNDDSDDDDESFLCTQNIPFYNGHEPSLMLPPKKNPALIVNKVRALSALSFSKQNIKITPPIVAQMAPFTARIQVATGSRSPKLSRSDKPTVAKTSVSTVPGLSDDSDDSEDELLRPVFTNAPNQVSNTSTARPEMQTIRITKTLEGELGLESSSSDEDDCTQKGKAIAHEKDFTRKTHQNFLDSSSDEDKGELPSTMNRKRPTKTSDFLAKQRASRVARATTNDEIDTAPSMAMIRNGTVSAAKTLTDRRLIGTVESKERKPSELFARKTAMKNLNSPSKLDDVTRRYEELIASSDSEDDPILKNDFSGKSNGPRSIGIGKENSQETTGRGDKTSAVVDADRPARYFLPISPRGLVDTFAVANDTSRIVNEEENHKKARRGRSPQMQYIKSVLESATKLPRGMSSSTPKKDGRSLSPCSSISSASPMENKAKVDGSQSRKRKAYSLSLSDDSDDIALPKPRSWRHTNKGMPSSSWSTDCEIDSPPSSPLGRVRSTLLSSSKKETHRRGMKSVGSPSVFDFVDETPRNKPTSGSLARTSTGRVRVMQATS